MPYVGPGPDELNSPHYPRNALERLGYMDFDSREEAAEYVQAQMDRAQIILKDTVEQARERGLNDEEIKAFIKEGILSGVLPRLAEQADPPNKNRQLILLVDKLPPEVQEKIEISIGDDDHVRVTAPFEGENNLNVEFGWIAALDSHPKPDDPEVSVKSLASHPKRRQHILKEIVHAVESRSEDATPRSL